MNDKSIKFIFISNQISFLEDNILTMSIKIDNKPNHNMKQTMIAILLVY